MPQGENRITPKRLATMLGLSSLLLFVVVGALAGESQIGFDWSGFDDEAGLIFLGAWAQLILAFAVWFQIRSSDAQVRGDRERHGDLLAREQRKALELERRDQAEALVVFMGHCANASAHYQHAGRSLGAMVDKRATDPRAMANVDESIRTAEVSLQAAATALFRVEVLSGHESKPYKRADEFWNTVKRQKKGAMVARQWLVDQHHLISVNRPPDAKRATRDTRTQRAGCVNAARALLTDRPGHSSPMVKTRLRHDDAAITQPARSDVTVGVPASGWTPAPSATRARAAPPPTLPIRPL